MGARDVTDEKSAFEKIFTNDIIENIVDAQICKDASNLRTAKTG